MKSESKPTETFLDNLLTIGSEYLIIQMILLDSVVSCVFRREREREHALANVAGGVLHA